MCGENWHALYQWAPGVLPLCVCVCVCVGVCVYACGGWSSFCTWAVSGWSSFCTWGGVTLVSFMERFTQAWNQHPMRTE